MGKLSITKNLIIIFFFISACTIIHSFSFAESIIMINSQSSNPGEMVTFTVSISPGTNDSTDIKAFGFDIQYNDKILEYIDYSADSIKAPALFPPQINKRSAGSLRAGGGFINPVKIDKTINLFHIDFKCLDCTESTTSLQILGTIDDLKNFTRQHGTFNCLGTEEKEEASDQQTDQDTTIQENPDEIIVLTNEPTSNDQQKPDNDQSKPDLDQPKPDLDQPKPDKDYFYTRFPPDPPASDQGAGGGAAGGQTPESSDISDWNITFRGIPSVQNTFPKDGAEDIKTDNGKAISDEKPAAISPNVTRCFIMSI